MVATGPALRFFEESHTLPPRPRRASMTGRARIFEVKAPDPTRACSFRTPVHCVAKRAWAGTLPRASYGPTIECADAGGDSLDTLHLVLRLETQLGREVRFD